MEPAGHSPTGTRHEVDWSTAAIDERVAIVHGESPAAARCSMRSCNTSGSPSIAIQPAARVAERVAGASADDVLGSPYVLVGTLDELAEELAQHHERWGFTSYVVRADVIDDAAALIDRLRSA